MVDRLLSDREILIQDGLSYFNGTTIPELKSRSVRKMPYLLNVLLSYCTVQYSVDCVVHPSLQGMAGLITRGIFYYLGLLCLGTSPLGSYSS